MKISSSINIAALVLFAAASVCTVAHAEPKTRKSRSKILMNEDEERLVKVTGSHIPQRVKLKSIGTNTPYNVRIYTREELESTGRQRPGAALSVLDPSITVGR